MQFRSTYLLLCFILFCLIFVGNGCDAGAPRKSNEDYERERGAQANATAQKDQQAKKTQVTEAHFKFKNLLGSTKPGPNLTIFDGTDPDNIKKSEEFLQKIGEIDVSQCPKDYQDAFNAFANSMKSLHQKLLANKGLFKNDKSKPVQVKGGLISEFNRLAIDGIMTNNPEFISLLDTIQSTMGKYEEISRKYAGINF